MSTQPLTPNESIELIQQAIKNAKERFEENGVMFMFWGLLVGMASFIQYYLIAIDQAEVSWYPYLILPVGSVFSFFYKAKEERKVHNPLGNISATLWIGISINLFLLAFAFYPMLLGNLVPIILILLALGMLVSGSIIRSRLLIFSGIGINIAAYSCFFLSWEFHPLVNGIIAIFAVFLPGLLFFIKQKKQHV